MSTELKTAKQLEQIILTVAKTKHITLENVRSGPYTHKIEKKIIGYQNTCMFDFSKYKIHVNHFMQFSEHPDRVDFEVGCVLRPRYDNTREAEAIVNALTKAGYRAKENSGHMQFTAQPTEESVKKAFQLFLTADKRAYQLQKEYIKKLNK